MASEMETPLLVIRPTMAEHLPGNLLVIAVFLAVSAIPLIFARHLVSLALLASLQTLLVVAFLARLWAQRRITRNTIYAIYPDRIVIERGLFQIVRDEILATAIRGASTSSSPLTALLKCLHVDVALDYEPHIVRFAALRPDEADRFRALVLRLSAAATLAGTEPRPT